MFDHSATEKRETFGWLLHAAGLAVTCALLGVAVIAFERPLANEARRLREDTAAARDSLEQLPGAEARLTELQTALAARRETQAELVSRVPVDPAEAEYLSQVTELARSSSVAIDQYHPGLPVEHEDYGSLEVVVHLHAPYENVCRFLAGIETLPRLCRARSLKITAPETEGEDYHVEVTLQIYFITDRTVAFSEVPHG